MDIINQFSIAMQSAGLRPPKDIVVDGRIHRCKTANGHGSNKAGWYVLYTDGVPTGAFGNWRSGEKQSWCSKSSNELTSEEQKAQRLRMAQINEQRKKEIVAIHKKPHNRKLPNCGKALEPLTANIPILLQNKSSRQGSNSSVAYWLHPYEMWKTYYIRYSSSCRTLQNDSFQVDKRKPDSPRWGNLIKQSV